MFLMAAAFEESALRGYLQFTLKRGIGFWWAALVLSAAFGLAHPVNTGENRVGIGSDFDGVDNDLPSAAVMRRAPSAATVHPVCRPGLRAQTPHSHRRAVRDDFSDRDR